MYSLETDIERQGELVDFFEAPRTEESEGHVPTHCDTICFICKRVAILAAGWALSVAFGLVNVLIYNPGEMPDMVGGTLILLPHFGCTTGGTIGAFTGEARWLLLGVCAELFAFLVASFYDLCS